MVYQRMKIGRLFDFLAPGICFLCHDGSGDKSTICARCQNDLPRAQSIFNSCEAPHTANISHGEGGKAPVIIDRTIASYSYKFPVNELIHQLKYRQQIIIAKQLGQELALTVSKVSTALPDCLLPVPLYQRRFLTRGFNQSLEIANTVGSELLLPVNAGLLFRTRDTLAQFALNPKQRIRNLRGAFKLGSLPNYNFIAIIDDIITTGATVNEMAALLKRAGVKRVEAWACARAES